MTLLQVKKKSSRDIYTLCIFSTAAEDYISISQSLLFSPGETRAAVDVGIISDSILEFPERFQLIISSTNDSRVDPEPGRTSAIIEILDTSGKEKKLVVKLI